MRVEYDGRDRLRGIGGPDKGCSTTSPALSIARPRDQRWPATAVVGFDSASKPLACRVWTMTIAEIDSPHPRGHVFTRFDVGHVALIRA